jgi:hypothetical protein
MQIPQGLSVYGLNIDMSARRRRKIPGAGRLDYLYILDRHPISAVTDSFGFASEKIIWRSEDVYGGSNNFIENLDKNNPDDPRQKAPTSTCGFSLRTPTMTEKKKSSS